MNKIENEIISLVKKSKAENIVLKLILIIICIVTMIFNSDEYKQIFLSNNSISSYNELKDSIDNKDKFVILDLTKAEETRFSFQNSKKEDAAKIYEVNYGNYNLLVVLKPNTALTKEVKGEILSENTNIKTIKEKLISDNKDKKYIYEYFSDMDYSDEEIVIKRKFYSSTILILLLIFGIILDLIKLNKPKKTRMYKKYLKKLNKEKILS